MEAFGREDGDGWEWPPRGSHPAPYDPVLTSPEAVGEVFEAALTTFKQMGGEALDEEAARYLERYETALRDFRSYQLYEKCMPLVQRFLAAEFDTQTPGRRGLGRMSTAVPRLGGRFSQVADASVQIELGAIIERIIVTGFATAIAVLHGLDPPPESRTRDLELIWRLWLPAAYAGLKGSQSLPIVTQEHRSAFEGAGRRLGLAGGASLRKRTSLAIIGHFYASAGAALYEVNTSLGDTRASIYEG